MTKVGNSSEELLGLVFPAAGATSDDLISISCIAGQAGSSGGTGQCVKALRREIRDVRPSLGTLWPVAPYERYKVVSSYISRYSGGTRPALSQLREGTYRSRTW
ncbi:hypothetical protein CGCVW01_v001462 [Colletotrichum viniferum]|nr:hypothetical protein CGCVW01_v001462 [Colletotrichum viniferum]